MTIALSHVLMLAAVVFVIGMGCLLRGRNLIMMLLGVEIMLNGAALAFVGAGLAGHNPEGQILALFVIAIAATEVSIGLAAILLLYKWRGSIACIACADIEEVSDGA